VRADGDVIAMIDPDGLAAFDGQEAGAFLAMLDQIHLVAIDPDRGGVEGRHFCADRDAALAWAAARNRSASLYWTVNRVTPGVHAKPRKADIVAARFIHVDIDPPRDGSGFDRGTVARRLARHDPPPGLVIDSGGGLQAFWRLDGECLDLVAVEAVNAQVRDAFAGDACQNIDRLMRLPGSVNWPSARKRGAGRIPATARTIARDDGRTHGLAALSRAFPLPRNSLAKTSFSAVDMLTADDLGLSRFDPVRRAIEAPPGVDRSSDLLACAGALVRAGFSDDQVIGVLINPANPVSTHARAQADPWRAAARALGKARRDALARTEAVNVPEPRMPAPPISATPYSGRDPATIPPRPWIYGRYLLRNTVTTVIAPGGVGKSSLMAVTALALVTGRPILGKTVWDGPKRCWLWNLEDDGDELARQIEGAARRHEIAPADYAGRLFVDSGLDGARLCIAVQDRGGLSILRPIVEALVVELIAQRIDVLIVDPFVSSHQVDENDNGKIDAVAKTWAEVAKRTGCAIVLVHHARKLDGRKVTTEASRGAGALTNAARATMVLNRMDADQGEAFDIPEGQRRRYFSVSDDKHNRAPAEAVDWYRMESVPLGNSGPEGGDSVGVVVRWIPPSAFDGIGPADLRRVQNRIAAASWREDVRSRERWAGNAVAATLGLDPEIDRRRISEMLRQWIANGALKVAERRDAKSMPRKFVEVGQWVIE